LALGPGLALGLEPVLGLGPGPALGLEPVLHSHRKPGHSPPKLSAGLGKSFSFFPPIDLYLIGVLRMLSSRQLKSP